MGTLFWILLMCIADSLLGLIGVVTLWMNQKKLNSIVFILVAFSAGALLGGGFFHLFAEALNNFQTMDALYLFIAGFIMFFILEKALFWHHCHKGVCDVHPYSYLILLGDALHNFIDGLVIAASFFVSVPFGLITTLMIISHEVPQELGNFGILIHGGFKKMKALFYNFFAQLTCIIGGIAGFFASGATNFSNYLIPIAAGGFIYIAASDLIPELHDEKILKKSILSFMVFLAGLAFMILTKALFE